MLWDAQSARAILVTARLIGEASNQACFLRWRKAHGHAQCGALLVQGAEQARGEFSLPTSKTRASDAGLSIMARTAALHFDVLQAPQSSRSTPFGFRQPSASSRRDGGMEIRRCGVGRNLSFDYKRQLERVAVTRPTSDSSLPSDRAALFFALGWSLLFTWPPTCRSIWVVPTVLAPVVGWSRVFLGVHYPLEVARVAIVALAAASLFAREIGAHATAALTDSGMRMCDWPLSALRSNKGRDDACACVARHIR